MNLESSTVHLWHASLVRPTAEVDALYQLLAPAERERAARFHFERDRLRFIVAHGLLRQLLGRYLAQDPATLVFAHNAYHKPYLPEVDLHFNLAHAHELAVYAFTRLAPVGVDVEHERPLDDMATLVANFFAPQEIAAWRATPPAQQPRAFFHCWTRKEAFIKALGLGLAFPLNAFAVTLTHPAQFLHIQGHTLSEWSLHSFEPQLGYVGALALQRPACVLQHFSL